MDSGEIGPILHALADPVRIRILACVAGDPKMTTEIAADLELPVNEIGRNLAVLGKAGLIETTTDGRIRLAIDRLAAVRELAEAGIPPEFDDSAIPVGLRQFFRDGRLVSMPARRSKQIEVLRVLIEDFAPETDYPEPDVNQIIARRFADFALIRRDFVDEGLMTRTAGVYRRTKI